tara:strand:- start:270 stop:383 length:114 start_codon:yes stop_codon:yes gene_type:complete
LDEPKCESSEQNAEIISYSSDGKHGDATDFRANLEEI